MCRRSFRKFARRLFKCTDKRRNVDQARQLLRKTVLCTVTEQCASRHFCGVPTGIDKTLKNLKRNTREAGLCTHLIRNAGIDEIPHEFPRLENVVECFLLLLNFLSDIVKEWV